MSKIAEGHVADGHDAMDVPRKPVEWIYWQNPTQVQVNRGWEKSFRTNFNLKNPDDSREAIVLCIIS